MSVVRVSCYIVRAASADGTAAESLQPMDVA